MKNRCLASVAALLFLFTMTAQAQVRGELSAAEAESSVWSQFIGEQLAASLASPADAIRESALQQIAYFARFHGALDLRPTVPALHRIYAEDPSAAYRLAAVAALSAIGDGADLWRLKEAVKGQTSSCVQYFTLAALADRYGSEIFAGDYDVARMARALMEEFGSPRIIVEQPTVAENR